MRIVAVSMLKNEADIVEAFCRHTAAFADCHLIFDHASTDGTSFILNKLQRDGLPIRVFTDDTVHHFQSERTTALMRRAVRDFQADWVVPLDADEFAQTHGSAGDFRETLAAASESQPLWVWMHDYGPHPSDDATEANAALRIRHWMGEENFANGKVIVPRRLAADPAVHLGLGNHELFRGNVPVEVAKRLDLWLAHFPARTCGQVVAKVVTGELQRLAGRTRGDHYQRHYEQLAIPGHRYFDVASAYLRGRELRPAQYWGDRLQYPPPFEEWDRLAASLVPDVGRLVQSLAAVQPSRWWRKSSRDRFVDRMREGVVLPDSRTAHALGAKLEVGEAGVEGANLRFIVRATNTRPCIWRHGHPAAGVVNVGVQLWGPDDRPRDVNFHRQPLPHDVDPGDTVEVEVRCPLPDAGMWLKVDLVSELVAWFETAVAVPHGAPPVRHAA